VGSGSCLRGWRKAAPSTDGSSKYKTIKAGERGWGKKSVKNTDFVSSEYLSHARTMLKWLPLRFFWDPGIEMARWLAEIKP